MLIIDMPIPVKEWNCLDCKALCVDMFRHYCCITKKTIDTLKNMRARPDWCPIKGELVRCGECKYKSKRVRDIDDEIMYCDFRHNFVDKRGFCSGGERKDGERDV